MNFDFLKDLRGLGYIYENCTNAEKLANTMPVQSVFTSRKSAELLAKFIYMAAHNQMMEYMSFADILSDMTVRKFIDNRNILDAFHFIRKNGNRAVHGDEQSSVDDALAVLQDLHYVAGETARMLGLINEYPTFDNHIEGYADVIHIDEMDIEEKAREMFLEYVEKFNAQQEREKYIEFQSFDELSNYLVHGNVEMHEYVEFVYPPKQDELIEYLQEYCKMLFRLSVERAPQIAEEFEISDPVTLSIKIMIDDKIYDSSDIVMFTYALNDKLPIAEKFAIDFTVNGTLREYQEFEDENGEVHQGLRLETVCWTGAGMLHVLRSYMKRNDFVYKLAVFYPDCGEYFYHKISGGKDIDIFESATPDIVEKELSEKWYGPNLFLWVDFDDEKHIGLMDKLRDIVREMIPEEEVPYCEDAWIEEDPGYLCFDIGWECKSLKDVQAFLDALNKVLLPIKDDISVASSGIWEIPKEFAVATWEWTDEGFKIKGICY